MADVVKANKIAFQRKIDSVIEDIHGPRDFYSGNANTVDYTAAQPEIDEVRALPLETKSSQNQKFL